MNKKRIRMSWFQPITITVGVAGIAVAVVGYLNYADGILGIKEAVADTDFDWVDDVASWAMVGIGAAMFLFAAYKLWKNRPKNTATTPTTSPAPPTSPQVANAPPATPAPPATTVTPATPATPVTQVATAPPDASATPAAQATTGSSSMLTNALNTELGKRMLLQLQQMGQQPPRSTVQQ